MEQTNNVNQQNELDVSVSPEDSEWSSFKHFRNGFKSKSHVKRSFLKEFSTSLKRTHLKRRKSLKTIPCFEESQTDDQISAPFFPQRSADPIYQTAIPNSITYNYDGVGSRIYNSRFTHDGKKFLATNQNGTSIFNFHDDGKIDLFKNARCPNLNWTITDLDISQDNKYMVHSTLSPFVHMLNIEDGTYINQFSLKNGTANVEMADELFWFFSLRIYSLKLSHDCKEIIAGCGKALGGAPVQIFDVESNKLKQSIFTHKEDVNSVCYLERNNSNIFISASDDGVCKLWDTRILKNFEPVGMFYGHVSGLAHIESKNDNRYFISNCKDQSVKLWDIRTATTAKKNYPFLKYDYRYETLSPQHIEQIKNYQKKFDQSVMSFWGHQVHSTLIRCHFSPVHGTNQRYIYTGSYDGKIYIFDTTNGQNVASLESASDEGRDVKNQIVRDCSWHPFSQHLISTNFHGDINRWEYTDPRDANGFPNIEAMDNELNPELTDDLDVDDLKRKRASL